MFSFDLNCYLEPSIYLKQSHSIQFLSLLLLLLLLTCSILLVLCISHLLAIANAAIISETISHLTHSYRHPREITFHLSPLFHCLHSTSCSHSLQFNSLSLLQYLLLLLLLNTWATAASSSTNFERSKLIKQPRHPNKSSVSCQKYSFLPYLTFITIHLTFYWSPCEDATHPPTPPACLQLLLFTLALLAPHVCLKCCPLFVCKCVTFTSDWSLPDIFWWIKSTSFFLLLLFFSTCFPIIHLHETQLTHTVSPSLSPPIMSRDAQNILDQSFPVKHL